MPIRILLADDHTIVRDGLRALVERETDMFVVAEAGDGRACVQVGSTWVFGAPVRSVLAARRTPVIRRPTPQPRRMDGPGNPRGRARTSVGLPERIASDMARMGCWRCHDI